MGTEHPPARDVSTVSCSGGGAPGGRRVERERTREQRVPVKVDSTRQRGRSDRKLTEGRRLKTV